jgi:hypothetical protein
MARTKKWVWGDDRAPREELVIPLSRIMQQLSCPTHEISRKLTLTGELLDSESPRCGISDDDRTKEAALAAFILSCRFLLARALERW